MALQNQGIGSIQRSSIHSHCPTLREETVQDTWKGNGYRPNDEVQDGRGEVDHAQEKPPDEPEPTRRGLSSFDSRRAHGERA